MKIGIISDTHGWIHPRLFEYFSAVDEIWHAGDIGNIDTADRLAAFKPLRAVYGNIDDFRVRQAYKEHLKFTIEGIKIWITHIGGSPLHYDSRIREKLFTEPPDIFICGHSHIAKVMHDPKLGFLFINPGAAGYNGFHHIMTALRLQIDDKRIHSLELIELGERGKVTL